MPPGSLAAGWLTTFAPTRSRRGPDPVEPLRSSLLRAMLHVSARGRRTCTPLYRTVIAAGGGLPVPVALHYL